MEQFRNFDQVRTHELWLQRHGFWKPWYELTDGQFSYGKLSYEGILRTTSVMESLTETWKVKRKKTWADVHYITNLQDENLGEISKPLFSADFNLQFSNGLFLKYKRTSVWKGRYSWVDAQGIVIAETRHQFFSARFLKFIIDPLHLKDAHLPLLLLLAGNLNLLMQRRAAAAH